MNLVSKKVLEFGNGMEEVGPRCEMKGEANTVSDESAFLPIDNAGIQKVFVSR